METADITETPQVDIVSAPKPKRAYKKKGKVQDIGQNVAPPTAPVRTPAMDKLEAEILEIVSQRSAANNALRNAKLTADQAQLNLKGAQEFLFSLEQEVNYRMTLLGQLKGGIIAPGQAGIPQSAASYTPTSPFEAAYAAPPQIGSYPSGNNVGSQPNGIEVVGGRRVRSESAEATRAML